MTLMANQLATGVLAFFTGGIGPWEVLIILLALLLLFGGKKLPALARGMGKGLRNFKEELNGVKKQITDAVENEPTEEASTPGTDAAEKKAPKE